MATHISNLLLLVALLLGPASPQNKRDPKANAKPPARNPKGQHRPTVRPAATEDDVLRVAPPNGARAAPAARNAWVKSKPSCDMRLTFLQNTSVTCNDGTTAGYYIREQRHSKRWIVFLEAMENILSGEAAGAVALTFLAPFDAQQPRRRVVLLQPRNVREQTQEYPSFDKFIGVAPDEKRLVPYCSSDIWIGTLPKSGQATFAFMGSLIIQEVLKDLIHNGLLQAKQLLLAGSSAGATGVLLNIDRVAALLEGFKAEALRLQGLVDSGWFLVDAKQPRPPGCTGPVACSPASALKKGLRMWNGILPGKCKQQFKRGEEWQCFLGYKLYPSLKTPVFVVQWLFDEEQLKLENVHLGSTSISEKQRGPVQTLGREMKNSLRDLPAVFAPSCLAHTLVTKSCWTEIQVKGVALPRALQCWTKRLHEPSKPLRNCPFHLIDTCLWPRCNPTCPALQDHAEDREA